MTQATNSTQYVAVWTSHITELTSVALDSNSSDFNEAKELLDSIKSKAARLIHLGAVGCNFNNNEEV